MKHNSLLSDANTIGAVKAGTLDGGCDLAAPLLGPISSEGEGRLLASMRPDTTPPQIDLTSVPPRVSFDPAHLLIDVNPHTPSFYFL
jgi:hypothetical protein